MISLASRWMRTATSKFQFVKRRSALRLQSVSLRTKVSIFGGLLLTVIAGFLLFQQSANAGTVVLTPNASITSNWTTAGTANASCVGHCGFVDENYSTPNTSNYLIANSTTIDEFGMSNFTLPAGVTTTSSITIYVYDTSATNAAGTILDTLSLTIGTGAVYQTAVAVTPVYNAWGWQSATFNVSYTQTQLDALQFRISRNILGTGTTAANTDTVQVATAYATASYTSTSTTTQAAYRWFSNWDNQVPGQLQANPTSGSDGPTTATTDGKSLFSGGLSSTNGNDWRIVKQNISDGSMMTAFGTGGAIDVSPSANDDSITSLAQDGSSLFAAGYDSSLGVANKQWRIERRDITTGQLISAFGTGGVLTINPTSGNDVLQDIEVDANYIYLSGYDANSGNEWRIEKRDKSTGALISAFGSSGVVTSDPSVGDDQITTVTMDGSYLYIGGYDYVGGTTSRIRMEKRDITTGALVTSFGTGGVVVEDIFTGTSPGFAEDKVGTKGLVLAGTSLYMAGTDYSPGNLEWRMERRDATTGATVSAFGTGGIIQSNPSANNDTAVVIKTDGNNLYIAGTDLVAGASNAETRIEKRALDTGAVVSPFGTSGVITSNPSSGNEKLNDMIVTSTGALYTIGTDFVPGNDETRIEARNSTTGSYGIALAAQNTAAVSVAQGAGVRLRLLLAVGTAAMPASSDTIKLQYAVKVTTCSALAGGSFSDVSSTTGDIRYFDNPTPADAIATSSIADDPTDAARTIVPQTYVESNSATNPVAIASGQDGLWDMSLVNYSAPAGKSYCFRVVKLDNVALNTYTNYPEISTVGTDTGMQYLANHTTPVAQGGTSVAASGTNSFFLDFATIPTNTSEKVTPQVEVKNTNTAFTGTSNLSTTGQSTFMNLPPIRYASCSVYDSTNNRMIVFGGSANDGTTYLNDVWALSLAKNTTATWTLLTANGAVGSPSVRRASSCTYDSANNRMVLFGGYTGTTNLNDLYSLSLGTTPTWSTLTATGTAPSIRRASRMIYDTTGGQAFVYAGLSAAYLSDLYKLTLGVTPAWSTITATGAPTQLRAGQGMSYDPVNRAMWVFGGTTATIDLNDVWKYNIAGNSWTNPIAQNTACSITVPATCPMPLDGVSMAYDSNNQNVVVFGGYNYGSNPGITANEQNSTWILKNLNTTATWQRTDAASTVPITTALPAPRFQSNAVYDPLNKRMVIFAGKNNTNSEYIKDLESLYLPTGNVGLGWGAVPTSNVMNGHDQMMPYYDATMNQLYAFGGFGNGTLPTTVTTGGHTSETYRLDMSVPGRAARWKNVSPQSQTGITTPTAREASSSAKDTKRNRMLIFGGMNIEMTYNDVWAMTPSSTGNNPTWQQICSPTSCGTPPPVRWLGNAVYDAANDRFVIFGGSGNSAAGVNLNDVWALTNLSGSPTWQQLSPTGTPPAGRWGSAVAYDAVNQRMIVFGGTADGGTTTDYNDTWAMSLGASPAWTTLTPTGTLPTIRARMTFGLSTYGGGNKLVIFSGYAASTTTHYNNLYVLDLATTNGAWTNPYVNNCTDSNAPSCRRSSSGVFDSNNNRLITINGRDAAGFFNSAYSFSLTTNTWTNLNPVNELSFSLPVTGLADNSYHWQYWSVGSTSGATTPISFGFPTNLDSLTAGIDFSSCSPPTVSTRLRTNSYFCGQNEQNKYLGNPSQ